MPVQNYLIGQKNFAQSPGNALAWLNMIFKKIPKNFRSMPTITNASPRIEGPPAE
jgi:hypothetical protein